MTKSPKTERSALEDQIDDLYKAPLGEFVAARTALAKSVARAEAQQVRKLAKPTVVPWAVNQVYWRARSVYDAVITSGERLRTAQVAALEGRKADVRSASDAHRRAIADAVQRAAQIASEAGSHGPPDALMRTFEALSMRADHGEKPGRLTRPLQPAGFEALTGVKVAAHGGRLAQHAAAPARSEHAEAPQPPRVSAKQAAAAKKRDAAERRRQEAERRKAEAARKKHELEVRKAEAALERARQRMAAAEAALKATRGAS